MDSPVMFVPCRGEPSLFSTADYLVFRWQGEGKIIFSVSRKGNAAYCHFHSDKAGLRHIKPAFNAFCEFVFWLFDWCEMVIATVRGRPSIERVLIKCGFSPFAQADDVTAFMRCR